MSLFAVLLLVLLFLIFCTLSRIADQLQKIGTYLFPVGVDAERRANELRSVPGPPEHGSEP